MRSGESGSHFRAADVISGEVEHAQIVIFYGTFLQRIVANACVRCKKYPPLSGNYWYPCGIFDAAREVTQALLVPDAESMEGCMKMPVAAVIFVQENDELL